MPSTAALSLEPTAWVHGVAGCPRGAETQGTKACGARHILNSGHVVQHRAPLDIPVSQWAITIWSSPYEGGCAGASGLFRQESKSEVSARPSEVAGAHFSSPSRPGSAAALSPGRCLGCPTVPPTCEFLQWLKVPASSCRMLYSDSIGGDDNFHLQQPKQFTSRASRRHGSVPSGDSGSAAPGSQAANLAHACARNPSAPVCAVSLKQVHVWGDCPLKALLAA